MTKGTVSLTSARDFSHQPYFNTTIYNSKGYLLSIFDDKRNLFNDGIYYGGPFVTNPTSIECNDLESYEYFSGEYIKKISCN